MPRGHGRAALLLSLVGVAVAHDCSAAGCAGVSDVSLLQIQAGHLGKHQKPGAATAIKAAITAAATAAGTAAGAKTGAIAGAYAGAVEGAAAGAAVGVTAGKTLAAADKQAAVSSGKDFGAAVGAASAQPDTVDETPEPAPEPVLPKVLPPAPEQKAPEPHTRKCQGACDSQGVTSYTTTKPPPTLPTTTTAMPVFHVKDIWVPMQYKTLQAVGVLPTMTWAPYFTRILDPGKLVNVVEIQNVKDEHTLRGRLQSGGWISLKDTKTDHVWAMPWIFNNGTKVSDGVSGVVSGVSVGALSAGAR